MKEEIIWKALYCPCVHESASQTISLHRTKEGAEDAIRKHRLNELANYQKLHEREPEWFPMNEFGQHESWSVSPDRLQP